VLEFIKEISQGIYAKQSVESNEIKSCASWFVRKMNLTFKNIRWKLKVMWS